MPFVKGQSGNPGGRPKVDKEIQEMARKLSPAAVKRLGEWMKSNNARASVAACQVILDRAYGKPTQPLASDPENPLPGGMLDFSKLTTEQVEALAAIAIKPGA